MFSPKKFQTLKQVKVQSLRDYFFLSFSEVKRLFKIVQSYEKIKKFLKPIHVRRNITLTCIVLLIALLCWIDAKRNKNKTIGRNIKKSKSQLSMKQYESHSDSFPENQSSEEQKIGTKKNSFIKTNTKYCTDIETDPHNPHQTTIQQKRSQLFFNIISSYQMSKQSISSEEKQEYKVEFEEENF